jgi:hypothetical protein
MEPRTNTGPYGPLTKSIDVDEALMLIELAREYPIVADWQDEALFRLPQASRKRRQEIIRSVRRKFLQVENEHVLETPLLTLLTTPTLEPRLKRDLLFAQYLRATPLVWEAIQQVVLPHAEADAGPLAKPQDAEIPRVEWDELLQRRLQQYTDTTLSRTRQHITAHLIKFGLLEARPVPGNRIARRFYAHFYDPDPRAFWFSLALEFAERGWTSRSLDYIINQSWTRVAYCTKTTYVRFIIDEAERAALVVTDFFGSEKQVTLRGPHPLTNVVEAIRYG